MNNKLKTRGNHRGGFSGMSGGWTQYSKTLVKRDDKAEFVKVETNKQIQGDTKPVDDHLSKQTTSIDTNDREERRAFKDFMPKENNMEE